MSENTHTIPTTPINAERDLIVDMTPDNDTEEQVLLTPSVIQQDMRVQGELSFSGELHIYGRVLGNIASPINEDGTLVIHEGGSVEGDIHAPFIIVGGRVLGDMFASARLTLQSSANIEGNVHYCALAMERGARINGLLSAIEVPPSLDSLDTDDNYSPKQLSEL